MAYEFERLEDMSEYTPLTEVADAYSNLATYDLDDVVIYDNTLYVCTTAVTTAEEFDSSKWTAVTVASLIADKADKSETVSSVDYDSANNKITKTINDTTTDVVSVSTIATAIGSQSASQGGTDLSLVTTGEKYTWNNKKDTEKWEINASSASSYVKFFELTATASQKSAFTGLMWLFESHNDSYATKGILLSIATQVNTDGTIKNLNIHYVDKQTWDTTNIVANYDSTTKVISFYAKGRVYYKFELISALQNDYMTYSKITDTTLYTIDYPQYLAQSDTLDNLNIITEDMINRTMTYQGDTYRVLQYDYSMTQMSTLGVVLDSSGVEQSAPAGYETRYGTTDYLKVHPRLTSSNTYGSLVTNSETMYGAYYDSSKTFISSFSYSYSSTASGNFTNIPLNAVYVKFSFDIGTNSTYPSYRTGALVNLTKNEFMQLRPSSDFTIPDKNNNTFTALSQYMNKASNLTYSSGIVTIGEGVNYIRVTPTFNFYRNSASAGRLVGIIQGNGSDVKDEQGIVQGTAFGTGYLTLTTSTVIRVKCGDKYTFAVKSANNDTTNFDYVAKSKTRFLIEVLNSKL